VLRGPDVGDELVRHASPPLVESDVEAPEGPAVDLELDDEAWETAVGARRSNPEPLRRDRDRHPARPVLVQARRAGVSPAAASWLIGRGANALEVCRWLGHASITTTYNVYGHQLPDAVDELAPGLAAETNDINGYYPNSGVGVELRRYHDEDRNGENVTLMRIEIRTWPGT
jgi:hypothetical protein